MGDYAVASPGWAVAPTGVRAARAGRPAGGDCSCRTVRRTQCRRSSRRSSSVVPPQMPNSWFVETANRRQSARTAHSKQTSLAAVISSNAAPVVPAGKNSSGDIERHAARAFQLSVRSITRSRSRSLTDIPPQCTRRSTARLHRQAQPARDAVASPRLSSFGRAMSIVRSGGLPPLPKSSTMTRHA